jgi:hypothetical protein
MAQERGFDPPSSCNGRPTEGGGRTSHGVELVC